MDIPSFKINLDKKLKSQILKNLTEVLDSGMFTKGKFAEACEEEIKKQTKCKNVAMVSSGSSALEAAAHSLRILSGLGKVLIPNNTFVATALAFERQGFEIEFYQNGINKIDLPDSELEDCVGVVVVDLGGIIPANIKSFVKRCDDLRVWVCEDAAQAYGSKLKSQSAGTFGDVGTFSFFGTKVITAGEGGAVVSKLEILIDDVKNYRDFGKPEPWTSVHMMKGWNARMNEFAAAVLLPQLKNSEKIVAERKRIVDVYSYLLESVPWISPLPEPKADHKFCGYKGISFLDETIPKDKFVAGCKEKGVKFQGSVYDVQLVDQPIYRGRKVIAGESDTPSPERMVCMPAWHGMTNREIQYVVKTIKEVITNL